MDAAACTSIVPNVLRGLIRQNLFVWTHPRPRDRDRMATHVASKALTDYSAEEILEELQRRIHCRGKKESRTILVGPPGCAAVTGDADAASWLCVVATLALVTGSTHARHHGRLVASRSRAGAARARSRPTWWRSTACATSRLATCFVPPSARARRWAGRRRRCAEGRAGTMRAQCYAACGDGRASA